MAIIGIMACGMVFVIVTGGIDLSVGFGAGFVSVVAAALLYYGVFDGPLAALGLSGTSLEDRDGGHSRSCSASSWAR